MKINTLLVLGFLVCGMCFAQTKITLDVDSAKEGYVKAGKLTVTPNDNSVSYSDGKITIEAAFEGAEYSVSGYFEGQVVLLTKNTVLKLAGAYIENNEGEPAVLCEAKAEVSSVENTVNYLVSRGTSSEKVAALHGRKNLVIGGSGTTYCLGNIYHGIKGDDVKIKGSGTLYSQGNEKGSALNCRSLTVEQGKTFKAYFINSKNAIKADNTITINSGEFYLYNNETAFKTALLKDSPKEKHGVILYGGTFHLSGNTNLHSTEKKAYLVRGAKIIGE